MTDADAQIRAVTAELGQLMGELRGSVAALQAILETPEVPGDEPAATV